MLEYSTMGGNFIEHGYITDTLDIDVTAIETVCEHYKGTSLLTTTDPWSLSALKRKLNTGYHTLFGCVRVIPMSSAKYAARASKVKRILAGAVGDGERLLAKWDAFDETASHAHDDAATHDAAAAALVQLASH